MKSKILFFFLIITQIVTSQINTSTVRCGSKEANDAFFKSNPAAYQEHLDFNEKTLAQKSTQSKSQLNQTYVIPVVIHVYGTTFNGGDTVDDTLVEKALRDLNKDFQGLNDDFDMVDAAFVDRRGTLDITFKLAQKDPNGIVTTGIIYHSEKNGYALNTTYDGQISEDAWDNYKYMNVYIQNDLYNDGNTGLVGVAYFPSTTMSDNNLARVVYQGAYLSTNTGKESASAFSHEFGHWLNLYHTFDNGCSGSDLVDDTPQEGGIKRECTQRQDCGNEYVNFENYMGYTGQYGCNRMFTFGQIERMVAALQHGSRITLWQQQNLIDTGLIISAAENVAPTITINSPENNVRFEEKSAFIVSATPTDGNGNGDINTVDFYLDNNLVKSLNYGPYENNYVGLAVGDHTIKVVVTDNGGLTNSAEITITIYKKIYFPEVQWITSNTTYTQNKTEFASGDKTRRIEIRAYTDPHTVIVKGPNNFEQTYEAKLGETIIIENIATGTWTVEIPAVNKKISKTFE